MAYRELYPYKRGDYGIDFDSVLMPNLFGQGEIELKGGTGKKY